MFQSKSYIERRHGKTGTDRAYYLKKLVQEYETTDSKGNFLINFIQKKKKVIFTIDVYLEAKQQVLANLANFAYDPINYNTLWDLHAIDLFLGKYYIA
jgi:hypothetical protein